MKSDHVLIDLLNCLVAHWILRGNDSIIHLFWNSKKGHFALEIQMPNAYMKLLSRLYWLLVILAKLNLRVEALITLEYISFGKEKTLRFYVAN